MMKNSVRVAASNNKSLEEEFNEVVENSSQD
jgi:hypothetical protein